MHEPDIAPLARRLAEENNVDWRRLAGTGDGGRVVERDVLGFLARVMAGEEAVDPTPEPVPDGMTAWPADDVAAYRARAAHAPPEESPPTLDDDMFLFEDPRPPAPAAALDDDAWFAGGSADHADGVAFGDAEPEAPADDDALLLVGDAGGPDEVAPASPPSSDWTGGEVRFDAFPELNEPDPTLPKDGDDRAHGPGGRSVFALPNLFAGDEVASAKHRDVPDLLFEMDGAADPTTVDDGGRADAAAPGGGGVHGGTEPDPEPEPRAGEATGAAVAGHDDAEAASAAAAAPRPSLWRSPGVALVSHGQVWRRRLDDRPLRKAVSEVAAELEASATTVTALLLARAAQRAGAAGGAVDALRWRAGVAERAAADTNGDLRTAVRELEQATGRVDGAWAGLVVADLTGLDLDEAVLHLDVPVLTLGRSVGEGAWLCLSGDEVDGAAVDALARVAALLAAPVRLLV